MTVPPEILWGFVFTLLAGFLGAVASLAFRSPFDFERSLPILVGITLVGFLMGACYSFGYAHGGNWVLAETGATLPDNAGRQFHTVPLTLLLVLAAGLIVLYWAGSLARRSYRSQGESLKDKADGADR